MRILLVINQPWDRTLGAARVAVELRDLFIEAGHHVVKLSYEDVVPPGSRAPRVAQLVGRHFSARAFAHIRQLVAREHLDVIDGQIGTIVSPKAALGFDGLLVARSVGLPQMYFEAADAARARWPERTAERRLSRPLRRRQRATAAVACDASVREADLVNVLNEDEVRYVEQRLGRRGDVVMLQHGLLPPQFAAFAAAARSAPERLHAPRVAFVGTWDVRKGSEDWPTIVQTVLRRVPHATFVFLGTRVPAAEVAAALPTLPPAQLEIRPSYGADDLPDLLASATVGALPSYIEGFPFSVLEMLAAGIPVVAYDAPGARETLRRLDPSLLTAPGDTADFGNRLVTVLEGEYEALSSRAAALAHTYRWHDIAAATLATYEARLAGLPPPTGS